MDRGQTAVKAANTGNGGTKASKAGVKNAAGASRPTARHPNFGPIKTVLEAISFGLGILGFIPGPQQPVLLALSSILGGVSAFLGCLETGINADCLINVAFALLPGPIFKLAKPFKATVAKVFRDTFAQFKNLFKKPPKPQIKPKQSKPSPATSCTTRNSFTGDTVVLMADGTSKSIKNVQLGDKVIATDPETGQQAARVVTALIRHGGDHDMVKITTGAGTVIHATDKHPFWDTIDQEWVNAEDLTTTDVLVTAGGTEVHVASISTYVKDVLAYNLTVDDLHTYHVSDADILVHNCNTGDPLRYERAPYHGRTSSGRKSPAPTNGGAALQNSIEISPATTKRRIGVDPGTGEIVVYDMTSAGVFHGHVRTWVGLEESLKQKLIRAGLVKRNGRMPL